MKLAGGNLRPLPLNDNRAEIQCEIRENLKIVDGIRDLTTIRDAGFAKILARDAVLDSSSRGQFNKTFSSVIYKCSHCFRVREQQLHL